MSDLPVAVVGVFLHVQFAETRLLLVERLFLNVCHRFPFRSCHPQLNFDNLYSPRYMIATTKIYTIQYEKKII